MTTVQSTFMSEKDALSEKHALHGQDVHWTAARTEPSLSPVASTVTAVQLYPPPKLPSYGKSVSLLAKDIVLWL